MFLSRIIKKNKKTLKNTEYHSLRQKKLFMTKKELSLLTTNILKKNQGCFVLAVPAGE